MLNCEKMKEIHYKESGELLNRLYFKYIFKIKNEKKAINVLKALDNLYNTLYLILLKEEFNGFNKKQLDEVFNSSLKTAFRIYIEIHDCFDKMSYMQLYHEFNMYLSHNKIVNISKEDFMMLIYVNRVG